MENITDTIDRNLPPSNPFFPTLRDEAQQAIEMLEIVEPIRNPKIRRSLDFLGTAWKYIAGSPDHNDLNMINNNMEKLLTNNNKQIIINNALNQQINKITEITNNLLNAIKEDNVIANEIAINLQNKIRLIKEEIVNIKYAIQWARIGIVNSIILNKKEIDLAIKEMNKENMPFDTAEDALELAKVSVLRNFSSILYVVKIPLTTKEIYENLILKAVIKNDVIIDLKYNNVLRNKERIFGIQNNCEKYNKISICKQNELLDLSNDFCIYKLIKSLNSSCHFINCHHIPRDELIAPGILFLNNYQGNITIDDDMRVMNGTYIINFKNESIMVNGRAYKNFEAPPLRIMPAIAQPTPREESLTKLLSLEALSELHINNTIEIQSLQTEKTVNRVSAGLTLIIIIVLVVSSNKWYYKRKKQSKPTEPPMEAITQANQQQEATSHVPTPEMRTFQVFQTLEDKRF